ncbi:hypothetical protein [Sphingorhabdus sp.]|jgi:hypothetical protein|uniref:hypothetical protein n=1 Tax=Sphingorhabdus sp. TaxID=1902408 RepID=UPI0037CA01FF
MQDRLQLLAEHWVSYKIWLIETVGLTNDAMHVHGALLILCVSALVLRRRPDSLWCWIIVFIAELFNEYADLRGSAPGEATMDAALHDIYNTMFWPTVILILGRVLFPRKKSDFVSPTAPLSDLPQ